MDSESVAGVGNLCFGEFMEGVGCVELVKSSTIR